MQLEQMAVSKTFAAAVHTPTRLLIFSSKVPVPKITYNITVLLLV